MQFDSSIRSFVRREGRNRKTILDAMGKYWPAYGIPLEGTINFSTLFKREAERILEIGFGEGSSLLHMAHHYPEQDFVGIEVYQTGIAQCLSGIHRENLTNIRLIRGDAVAVLQKHIPDNTFSRVQLFFPDPWPKRKHHKRRLVQPAFVELVAKKLKPQGIFHIATDWRDYAVHALNVLNESPQFQKQGAETFSKRPAYRPLTKFEVRGQGLGHTIFDLLFIRT